MHAEPDHLRTLTAVIATPAQRAESAIRALSRKIAWRDRSLSVMTWVNLSGPFVGRPWSGRLGPHSALLGST
jgi:hypothetical protein